MTSRPGSSPFSEDPSLIGQLTREQRERLSDALERYLAALETGAPLAPEAMYAEYPDLASPLASYFRSLEDLHEMAAGFGGGVKPVEDAAHKPEESARRIGDFELLAEIGRGGMGVVYEARQISLDRRVAVKLLPFAAVLDAKQIARFKHEAQAAAQLHHPNIVPVFAIGVERGVHYYAMQYIDGQPLDVAIEQVRDHRRKRTRRNSRKPAFNDPQSADRRRSDQKTDFVEPSLTPTVEYSVLSTQSSLPLAPTESHLKSIPQLLSRNNADYYHTVARLGVQAAEALHAAHEFGVVHRDIKPSNLLVEPSGKLWITDFGLARFQRDASLTRTGDVVGTMRYMSPEQAAGQSALVDHRSDIYSLGVTLYELACLQPAFPEERGPALLKQIDQYDPPRPSGIRPDIPRDLETVILKAMAREREERYETAQALAADLACILEGKATAARPPTLVDRAGRWVRRHQRMVAAAMLALSLVVIGLTVSLVAIGSANYRANLSQQRLQSMQHGAEQMLDEWMHTARALEDIPGADHIRQRLLDQTRTYYRSLADQTQDDERLQLAAAVACGKAGSLLEQLGEVEDALAAHQDARSRIEKLANRLPHDPEFQRQLALAENNCGLALMRLGNLNEARQSLEKAAQRQERLLARSVREVQFDSASTLCNLGLVLQQLELPTAAEAALNQAIDRLRTLPADAPDQAAGKKLLATAYNNLAGIYRTSRPAEAVNLHRQAAALLQALSDRDPNNLDLRRELAVTLDNLGSALARTQQYRTGRRAHEQAIETCEELVRLAPTRVSFRTDLALDYNNLGTLEHRDGRLEAAERAFRRSIEIYQAHLDQFPADPGLQSRLGGSYNNLGVVLERAERFAAAAAAFQTAIEHQQAALASAPLLPGATEYLEKHQTNHARALEKLKSSQQPPSQSTGTKHFPDGPEREYNAPSTGRADENLISVANRP